MAASEIRDLASSMTGRRWGISEACVAAAAFAVLCVLVLRASPYLPEPDDSAYRASIVAMSSISNLSLSQPSASS